MTSHGISSEHMPAADTAAWSLLSLLLFCILCFAIAAWVLWRREKRQPPITVETTETEQGQMFGKTTPKKHLEPWERDENWWKK